MRFDELPEGAPPIYGYEAKWIWDRPDDPLEIFECPARIPGRLASQIRTAALGAYQALDCRDWCRVDIRCDADGIPNIVELNPLPGILPDPRDNSCFPKAARAAGMSYDELIRTVADIAWRRISGRSLLAEAAA
jgi:D-alanine-D-alanine ligase